MDDGGVKTAAPFAQSVDVAQALGRFDRLRQ